MQEGFVCSTLSLERSDNVVLLCGSCVVVVEFLAVLVFIVNRENSTKFLILPPIRDTLSHTHTHEKICSPQILLLCFVLVLLLLMQLLPPLLISLEKGVVLGKIPPKDIIIITNSGGG